MYISSVQELPRYSCMGSQCKVIYWLLQLLILTMLKLGLLKMVRLLLNIQSINIGLEGKDHSEVLTNDKFKKEIIDSLNRLATENQFNSLEKIKKIHFHTEPFSVQNDMLTPTFKLKRNIAKKVFKEEID